MAENKTFPLYFLFVLVTFVAVALAMYAAVINNLDLTFSAAINVTGLGAIVGFSLGLLVGLYHVRQIWGAALGGLLGTLLGSGVVCLYFVDENAFPKLVTAQVGGSVFILFLAALLRFGVRTESE